MFNLLCLTDAPVVDDVDVCLALWSWQRKIVVKLAINTDRQLQCNYLIFHERKGFGVSYLLLNLEVK
jgi:hypothetical protein